MSKIINFFGAPCSGKSYRTAEAYLALQKCGCYAEMCREYAKEKVHEKNDIAINCEPYIIAHELYNIERYIESKVEYIVCDCPLLVPAFYNKTRTKTFELFALELFNKFDNYNFFLRVEKNNFKKDGRIHNLEESLAMEEKMLGFLKYYDIPFTFVERDEVIDGNFLFENKIIDKKPEIKNLDTKVKVRICPTCGVDCYGSDFHLDWCKTRWGRRGWRELGEYDS